MMPLYRLSQCFERVHTSLKSLIKYLPVNSVRVGPLRQAESLSVNSNQSIGASVSALLEFKRPHYIARFIVTVVIREAVKGVLARWPFADIRQEVLKGIPPTLAHAYSAASVILISDQILVIAALHEALICNIFRRFMSTPRLSMFSDSVNSSASA